MPGWLSFPWGGYMEFSRSIRRRSFLLGAASSIVFILLCPALVGAQSTLPPVTVEAPSVKKRTATAPPETRRSVVAAARRGKPKQISSIPSQAATLGAGHGAERANGPVNGYVATRSASSTKTDTPIIETPQAISVVSREQIRDQQGQTLGDVLTYVPGVQVQSGNFGRVSDNISIRGFDVAAGNGGILRDGLKLTSGVYDSTTEPYGLERLEVVKGASSILYGQVSPGGFLNAISKRPTEAPFGEVNLSLGSYNRKELSADVSGPLTKDGTLLYRFTGLVRDSDTYMNYVPDDKIYVAPALTWRPDYDTSLTVLGYYQKSSTKFPTVLPQEGTVFPTPFGKIPPQNFLGEPGFDRFNTEAGAIGYQFEHSFNNSIKVRQNLRYYDAQTDWDYLVLLGPLNGRTGDRIASSRVEKGRGLAIDTSVEAKLQTGPAAHTVITGVDYYRSTLDSNRFQGSANTIDVFNPVYGSPVVVNRAVNRGSLSTSDQVGFYVQDQIKLLDKLVILLGGRHDSSAIETQSYRNGSDSVQNDGAWTGRAGVVYLTDSGLAPFFSFGQSFQASVGTDFDGNPFRPTTGVGYEAGVRYQVPGTKTLLSASVFKITQQNVLTADPDPAHTGFSVQQGEVKSQGVELEAKTEFGPWTTVASYTYTDTRVTKSNDPYALGNRVSLVPYNAASIWGFYDFGDIGIHGLKLGGGLRYVGETFNASDGFDPAFLTPSYLVADLMASYDLKYLSRELNGFTARLNVKNLFNKEYVVCVGVEACRYGDPQTVIGTLSYRW